VVKGPDPFSPLADLGTPFNQGCGNTGLLQDKGCKKTGRPAANDQGLFPSRPAWNLQPGQGGRRFTLDLRRTDRELRQPMDIALFPVIQTLMDHLHGKIHQPLGLGHLGLQLFLRIIRGQLYCNFFISHACLVSPDATAGSRKPRHGAAGSSGPTFLFFKNLLDALITAQNLFTHEFHRSPHILHPFSTLTGYFRGLGLQGPPFFIGYRPLILGLSLGQMHLQE
jgi:hypothetical protein